MAGYGVIKHKKRAQSSSKVINYGGSSGVMAMIWDSSRRNCELSMPAQPALIALSRPNGSIRLGGRPTRPRPGGFYDSFPTPPSRPENLFLCTLLSRCKDKTRGGNLAKNPARDRDFRAILAGFGVRKKKRKEFLHPNRNPNKNLFRSNQVLREYYDGNDDPIQNCIGKRWRSLWWWWCSLITYKASKATRE